VSQLVDLRRDGEIAIIVIDNPPVNALSNAVRSALVEALSRARDDATAKAVVIACAGRTFIAGADITEFGKPPQKLVTNDVIAAIETLGKPVIAALHGTTFGGGLELAQGCHFRIAAPGTRLGQPEIKLGIIPGAGGTQRLPRLAGMEQALPMILTGNPIAAQEALVCGLVDEIVEGDLIAAAIDFAKRVLAGKRPLVLARAREEKLAAFKSDRTKFDKLAAPYIKRGKGLDAPAAAIAALRWAIELPFDEALARERETFLKLVAGDQAAAQRHIFFAEREAAKVPDLPPNVKPREIKRAAVIGAGTMGVGIAMCFANAGIPVTVIETSQQALTRGLDAVAKNYQTSVTRGTLAASDMERRMDLIKGEIDLAAIANADFVIEAAFEDMEVKKQIFANLDRLAKAEAILATNTSYLDVDEIAQATRHPGRVLGLHFFSPANVMRLVEVVRGAATAPEALATAIAVSRRIGKAPAVVGVCHGFAGNRMHRLRSIETERVLLEGALPQQIDAAMTAFGFPMGPLAASDLAGLDISWRMRKALARDQAEWNPVSRPDHALNHKVGARTADKFTQSAQARLLSAKPVPTFADRAPSARAEIADRLCEMGRFGQKTGRGFYLYEAGARAGKPDPEVEQLIADISKKLGIERRAIEDKEIVERLLFPMINEAARILEEGIALRPGDIDVIWVHGYGFPVWRGGPMYYADALGLAYVRDRLTEFSSRTGDARHAPARLLVKLADEGKGFSSLQEKS